MMGNPPSWFAPLSDSIFNKCIKLVISGYSKIKANPHTNPPLENQRRNELVREMRNSKLSVGLVHVLITTEASEFDENNNDIGRMDITVYYSNQEDKYITFECKRFLKKDLTPSYFQSQFNKEGIQRFVDGQYSATMHVAGMIAFVETGDFQKSYRLFVNELPKTDPRVQEHTSKYHHQYVFQTKHLRKNNKYIYLVHILMDFT